eukprot:scaffold628_cov401-Prasinococcus_capsulatus_cf.AAC.5
MKRVETAQSRLGRRFMCRLPLLEKIMFGLTESAHVSEPHDTAALAQFAPRTRRPSHRGQR